MDTGALFIGFCLAFLAGSVLTMIVAAIEIRSVNAESKAHRERHADLVRHWREAYEARDAQLKATRIALVEAQKANDDLQGENNTLEASLFLAQKNDSRDPVTGRFVKSELQTRDT